MAQLSAHEEAIRNVLKDGWRLTPATMAYKITGGEWIPARHLMYISKIVASEIAKGNARIIVTMPPRHGKSEFLSVHTHEWHLERWPQKFTMGVSYGADLATDFSLRVRDTFQNPELEHLLHTRLRKDKQRVDRFLTHAGGGLTAAGLGGVLTGRGGDLITLDDYVKNAEAALSQAQRDAAWEWVRSTLYTRLEPGGSMIILATRWDVDDIIGRFLQEMPDRWTLINLPAFAEEDDPLGRAVGEPLWPERYGEEALLDIKTALGGYWWDAMYQQRPRASLSGENYGEKLKVIDASELPHPSHLEYIRSWDLASSEEEGDWTAGPLMARDKKTKKIYIPDIRHFRKTPGGTEIVVGEVAEGDGYGVKIWMEQEPGSAGKGVIEHYHKYILPGYHFEAEKPSGRIEVRASPFLAAVEAGNVHVVNGPWVDPMRQELNRFPNAEHDDILSACALGYDKLTRGKFGSVVWGRGSSRGSKKNSIWAPPGATPRHHKDKRRRSRLSW